MPSTTRTRKSIAPAVVLTPEQLEAQALREARTDAYCAARTALINKARNLAERLHPGRVFTYQHGEDFTVMFGDPNHVHMPGYRGPGNLELRVDISPWARQEGSDEFMPPTLRIHPRSYSLGSDVTLDLCEALGRSMIEAAAFGRTLIALAA